MVARAASLSGKTLQGVVVFGSWARDELAADADVDVRPVVDRQVAKTRDLYRSWNREPLPRRFRKADVHIENAPASVDRVGVCGTSA